jgi:exonuclease III
MGMRFGTWNIRSLYRNRIRSLKTVTRELGKYKLDLVGVPEVRWEKGGAEQVEEYTFFYGQGNGNHQLGTGIFVHKRIVSLIRREEIVSDRISYIILRGHWCNIIRICMPHVKIRGNHVKDSFCEELGHVFDEFPRYNMKIFYWVILVRK